MLQKTWGLQGPEWSPTNLVLRPAHPPRSNFARSEFAGGPLLQSILCRHGLSIRFRI